MNNLNGILFLALALLVLVSCTSSRKVVKSPLKEAGVVYLFDKMKGGELKYDWLTAKFSASLEINKNKTEFKGMIRLKRDSVLWMSLSPALGIEMVRLYVTQDTIKMLNRLKSTYFIGNFNFINLMFNTSFDFDMLQGIILGNDFAQYENGEMGHFKASVVDNSREYKLTTADRRRLKKDAKEEDEKRWIQNIWLNADHFKITKLMIKEKSFVEDDRKIEADYSNFELVGTQLFPHKVTFSIYEKKDDPIRMTIDYSKVEINDPLTFPFSVSNKYERIKY